MAMKLRFITLAIIFIAFSGHASQSRFYNINSMYGISMREVNSICKDNYGFIWASSKTGILRLTEKDYRVYHLPYETANVITVKLIYENSKLIAY